MIDRVIGITLLILLGADIAYLTKKEKPEEEKKKTKKKVEKKK